MALKRQLHRPQTAFISAPASSKANRKCLCDLCYLCQPWLSGCWLFVSFIRHLLLACVGPVWVWRPRRMHCQLLGHGQVMEIR